MEGREGRRKEGKKEGKKEGRKGRRKEAVPHVYKGLTSSIPVQ